MNRQPKAIKMSIFPNVGPGITVTITCLLCGQELARSSHEDLALAKVEGLRDIAKMVEHVNVHRDQEDKDAERSRAN